MADTSLGQDFHPQWWERDREPRVHRAEAGTAAQQACKCKYKEENQRGWYLTLVLMIRAPEGCLSCHLPTSVLRALTWEEEGIGVTDNPTKHIEVLWSHLQSPSPKLVAYFIWRISSFGVEVSSLIFKKPLAATRQNRICSCILCDLLPEKVVWQSYYFAK